MTWKEVPDIKNMQPGGSGWTVPWAVSKNGDEYEIRGDYKISTRGGKVQVHVQMRKDGKVNLYVPDMEYFHSGVNGGKIPRTWSPVKVHSINDLDPTDEEPVKQQTIVEPKSLREVLLQ